MLELICTPILRIIFNEGNNIPSLYVPYISRVHIYQSGSPPITLMVDIFSLMHDSHTHTLKSL